MKKISKLFLIFCLFFSISSANLLTAKAENNHLKFNLNGINFSTLYSEDDYYLLTNTDQNENSISIIDKKNERIVEKFSTPSFVPYNYTMRTYTNTKYEGDVQIKTEIKLYCYTTPSGTFRQVERVSSSAIYLGNYQSQAKHEDDNLAIEPIGGSYPSSGVDVSMSTTVVFTIGSSSGGSLSASLLDWGFSVSHSTNTETYYRKRVSANYRVSI